MVLSEIITIIDDKCVNCHQCIQVCPINYCNDGSGEVVRLNSDLCIGCGECIVACTHGARVIKDDLTSALEALHAGEKIIAIAAPAIAANFPGKYLQFNGWLKSLGISAVFDVSFGAELTVKSYIEHIKMNNPNLVISQPCPALVTYIQIYKPELIPYLAPADSPMAHTMKMIREYYPQYKSHKILVVSPCIAKKREFDEIGLGDFNVTMKSLDDYLKKENLTLDDYPEADFDNQPAERAVLFSTPGGLLRTALREVPDIGDSTRKIEGPSIVYDYLSDLKNMVDQKYNPLLVDCLNCDKGCNGGTGTVAKDKSFDEIEAHIEERNRKMQQFYAQKGFIRTKKNNLKNIRKTVEKFWKQGLYSRKYRDLSSNFKQAIKIPDQKRIESIFKDMLKESEKDIRNCASCGYNSCSMMATAIFNNLNKKENCHVYLEKISVINLKNKESMILQLDKEIKSITVSVKQILESVNRLSTDIGTQYHAIEDLMASARLTIGSVKGVESITQKKKETLDSLVGLMNSGLNKIAQTDDIISSIAKNTDSMMELLGLINNVTDQTNILAFNAAIESAHAGDSGKGFAIVASEIRRLSMSAAESTEQISKSLLDTVQKMNDVLIVSRDSRSSFKNIYEEVMGVEESFQQILMDVKDLSARNDSMLKTINLLTQVADEVRTQSESMKNNAEGIGKSLELMKSDHI